MNALPRLREDLRLQRGGTSPAGAPLWVVHDPVANSYFEVSFEMLQLLSLWNQCATGEDLANQILKDYGRRIEPGELLTALQILISNQFIDTSGQDAWQQLHSLSEKKHPWYVTAFHSYLFFKIPLFQPQAFLQATWPVARLFFNNWFFAFASVLGLIGLFFVSRQWDMFSHSVSYMFTFEGAIVSVAAIILVKSLHELGHGYMAYRYGCHVPTMGLAFMTFAPMLYTDISDAWKLTSKRERLMIDSAGILVEIVLGMLCLFLWSFLPDGALRSAVFVMATVSWVMSLFVNLSPLMRFDGYFIFSDLLGLPNLHTRTFAHFRYRLRRFLFGIDEEPVERFSWKMDIFLTIFAITIIIYRFSLYIGIALLVYHFIVKFVGIALFLCEVGFFMIMPIWRELKHWWQLRRAIASSRRLWITFPTVAALVTLVFLPVSSSIDAPAVLEPENFQRLFSAEAGQIAEINVKDGATVAKGDLLFAISSPKLANQKKTAAAEISLRKVRLARIASDRVDLVGRQVLEQEIQAFSQKLAGLQKLEDRLLVRADFDGKVTNISNRLYVGRAVSRSELLGVLIGGDKTVSRGYISGTDIARISPNSHATFIPDDLSSAPVPLQVSSISESAVDTIDLASLASSNGGRIAVAPERNTLVPVFSQYAVKAESGTGAGAPGSVQRGILKIKAAKSSLADAIWYEVSKVVVRESGI